jgi:hypothetical protein
MLLHEKSKGMCSCYFRNSNFQQGHSLLIHTKMQGIKIGWMICERKNKNKPLREILGCNFNLVKLLLHDYFKLILFYTVHSRTLIRTYKNVFFKPLSISFLFFALFHVCSGNFFSHFIVVIDKNWPLIRHASGCGGEMW